MKRLIVMGVEGPDLRAEVAPAGGTLVVEKAVAFGSEVGRGVAEFERDGVGCVAVVEGIELRSGSTVGTGKVVGVG